RHVGTLRCRVYMCTYDDWLAHVADYLTPGQLESFSDAADAYFELPLHAQRDPENAITDSAEDDHALMAILRDILMESSLMTAAREARQAQSVLDGWIRGMAARGVSESQIAEEAQEIGRA